MLPSIFLHDDSVGKRDGTFAKIIRGTRYRETSGSVHE